MKQFSALLVTLCLLFVSAAFAEQPQSLLGQSLPDFTAPVTDGGEVTLSSLLQEKDVVVVNLFASWCPPCEREFPEMEQVYSAYGDRMAILALSAYDGDTMEVMEQYKREHGLSFTFGLAPESLMDIVTLTAYPTTLVLDRDGAVGFVQVGAFSRAKDFESVVSAFLGEDYQSKTVALYTAIVADQYGYAVPGAYVSFCTDTVCEIVKADEGGLATLLAEKPDNYHLSVLKAPQGYAIPEDDAGVEMGPASGMAILQITRE